METRILEGKNTAAALKAEVAAEVESLRVRGVTPGLAVVLVGDDPASQVYVRSKARACEELGIHSEQVLLPGSADQEEVLQTVGRLNRADEIDGILVQLPLPGHMDTERILQAVNPIKDVDGFTVTNVGKLSLGRPALAPCTPMGILEMLKHEKIPLAGAHAVIVGRSNIVGKPMGSLLLLENCTVTICHSKTRDLAGVCRTADILVAAIGRPAMITREFIKPGAVIVDVGINRIDRRDEVIRLFGENPERLASFDKRGSVLVGDVHPCDPLGLASAVTPVPGGVGPLTIAHLLKNTLTACQMRRGQSARKTGVPQG